jgi:hypothetical protein
MCVAAVTDAETVSRRSLAAQRRHNDLQQSTPELDTIPANARAIARACGARFTLANVSPMDLPALFTLALMAGNDALARTVVLRQVAMATDPAAQDAILGQAAQGYLAAEPARLTEADWTVAVADSIVRAHAHGTVVQHYPFSASSAILQYAHRTFNRQRLRKEAERIITGAQGIPRETLIGPFRSQQWLDAYKALAELAFVDHPDSLLAVAQRAKDDLERHPSNTAQPLPFGSTSAILDAILPQELQYTSSEFSSLPSIDSAYWFPAKPATWPVRGTVTLLLYGLRCGREMWQCAGFDELDLPQLLAQYDSQNIAVAIAVVSERQFLTNGPLTPAAEADSISWFYRNSRHLPVTVAMIPSVVHEIAPDPDGRRQHRDTSALGVRLGKKFGAYDGANTRDVAVLFGRDGAPLFVGSIDRGTTTRALLRALIERTVAGTPDHPALQGR